MEILKESIKYLKEKISNMDNKGYPIMEYIMTYDWAILVVVIIGIVLWQLGVFNIQ